MTSFEGRVVLVTGGGAGIGRALASAFHARGARVAIASRDPERLKQTATTLAARAGDPEGGRLIPVRLDVRKRESARRAVAAVVESWERIDVLINNAGISGWNSFTATDEEAARQADEKWNDIIDTNLHGIYHVTREVLPHMPRGGRVINISSVLGKFGVPGATAYCASKHAVIGFTRALAAELAPRGITVNAICPGWVDTAMARRSMEEQAAMTGVTAAEFRRKAMDEVPLGRILQPEEIAPLALHLASAAAEAMTGQALNIEGGATTW